MSNKSYDQRLKERWKRKEYRDYIKKVDYPSYGGMVLTPHILYFLLGPKKRQGR